MEGRSESPSSRMLLVQARSRVCSLPLDLVSETMRCLPVQPVPGAPPFVQGISILRGETVPVVDLGLVLGETADPHPRRLVSLRIGDRRVALAVEAVLRIVSGAALNAQELPPLLRGAAERTVRAIGTLDRQFLTVLEAARLVPADVWTKLAAPAGAPR